MNKEISAIDAIYLLLERVETLDKRFQVIDDNIKILSNKVSKLIKAGLIEPSSVGQGLAVDAAADKRYSPQNSSSQQKVEKLVLGNIKVFGYIVNKEKRPLVDVQVKVFDNENQMVKDNKTNSDGYWEVRLPPGRFGVEYIHKNFKPINRTIELTPENKEHEVR